MEERRKRRTSASRGRTIQQTTKTGSFPLQAESVDGCKNMPGTLDEFSLLKTIKSTRHDIKDQNHVGHSSHVAKHNFVWCKNKAGAWALLNIVKHSTMPLMSLNDMEQKQWTTCCQCMTKSIRRRVCQVTRMQKKNKSKLSCMV